MKRFTDRSSPPLHLVTILGELSLQGCIGAAQEAAKGYREFASCPAFCRRQIYSLSLWLVQMNA